LEELKTTKKNSSIDDRTEYIREEEKNRGRKMKRLVGGNKREAKEKIRGGWGQSLYKI